MGIGPAERELLTAVEEGRTAEIDGGSLPAELIRKLVLGLAVNDNTWATARRLLNGRRRGSDFPRTPVGISIHDAVIGGDLDLTSAIGEDGGPMCPLAFEKCRFEGRFLGAQARFSRLSFIGCTFVDAVGRRGAPTIELSGAAIDSDLHMPDIHPYGTRVDEAGYPEGANHYLTVRLNGARIDGELDLCRSHLRARPPAADETAPDVFADDNDALDLTLVEVRGDIQLLRARSEGRTKIRTAHIGGDVWMTGASLENPHATWALGQALLIQGTRIDGFLMLDGGFEKSDKSGVFRTFDCRGTLKLEAADIGRSFYLEDARVRGAIEAPLLCVRDDVILHGEVGGPIDLTGCRIGGSLDICRLNLTIEAGKLILRDGSIGRTLRVAPSAPHYRFVAGRQRVIEGQLQVKLVETLWRTTGERRHQQDEDNRSCYDQVRAAFLTVGRLAPLAIIYHLDGHKETLDRVKARLPGPRADWRTRSAIHGLRSSYVLTGERPFGPDDPAGRLEDGLFVRPRAPKDESAPAPLADDWFPMAKWETLPPSSPLVRRFAAFVRPKPLLQARIDLEGLNCDMLRDAGGWAWGNHSDPINMNHFVYRRADWRAEPSVARSTGRVRRWLGWLGSTLVAVARNPNGGTLVKRWEERPRRRAVKTRRTRSSFQWLLDWGKGIVADFLWLPLDSRLSGVLREESAYLSPWQVRRNWIFRQFARVSRKQRDLVSISRYRIHEDEYRPQPFENAIAVARAEGREELAVHFEMLKRRIEWRLFNQWIRWPLAFAAINLGAVWLLRNGGNAFATVAALTVTLVMMTFVSAIDNRLRRTWHWLRRVAREAFLYSPAILLLLVFDDWHNHPFHFIIAFLIFVGIRFISFLASAVMRFGFGYLRRPAQAIVTLIAAFLLGTWGVNVANRHRMLVLAAEPSADMVAPEPNLNYSHNDPRKPHPEPQPLVVGAAKAQAGQVFVHEVSCDPTVSEPLYALDILIPLVDLHEESRCGIRRVPEGKLAPPEATQPGPPPGGRHLAAPERGEPAVRPAKTEGEAREPAEMGFRELWDELPRLTIEHHRFWWWMKALYAIAGWFIVSLALLTFAQVNRTHGGPAEGGG